MDTDVLEYGEQRITRIDPPRRWWGCLLFGHDYSPLELRKEPWLVCRKCADAVSAMPRYMVA